MEFHLEPKNKAKADGRLGFCLSCGHKLTLCGLPFSAEIECRKCFTVNVYSSSQQPVGVRLAAANLVVAAKMTHK